MLAFYCMGEFELIEKYFKVPHARKDVVMGPGDDCALLTLPPDAQLAVSTDTLVSGVHFFPDMDPVDLGYKALAVNLSDLAAMGAEPRWVSLALTLPAINERFLAQQDENPWSLQIKRHDQVSVVTWPFNPLDAQGWHGDLCVVRLNWRDIRPLMSHRYHLPPSAHTTFVASRFVVCTFVPRPIESDPGALRVPF